MAKKKQTDADGTPVSQVMNLADLVVYQAGSIVSRTLIDRKSGTVTLFAFDKGQALSEHTAPYDAMVCVLDGRAQITIAGEAHRVREAETIVMPANVPHAVHAPVKFKMMLVMIRS